MLNEINNLNLQQFVYFLLALYIFILLITKCLVDAIKQKDPIKSIIPTTKWLNKKINHKKTIQAMEDIS